MDKTTRGNASQFFIAGQLCRMGYSAVVTLGNTPNTDILCSNVEGTKFVHIQVKTYVPGIRTCSVGKKAQKEYGPNSGKRLNHQNQGIPNRFALPTLSRLQGTNLRVREGHLSNPTTRILSNNTHPASNSTSNNTMLRHPCFRAIESGQPT